MTSLFGIIFKLSFFTLFSIEYGLIMHGNLLYFMLYQTYLITLQRGTWILWQ